MASDGHEPGVLVPAFICGVDIAGLLPRVAVTISWRSKCGHLSPSPVSGHGADGDQAHGGPRRRGVACARDVESSPGRVLRGCPVPRPWAGRVADPAVW